MSENSEKDNKPQVTSKGVSGTKELKVRRVHKKKAEPETEAAKTVEKEAPKAVETVKAPEAVEAPKKTAKAAISESPSLLKVAKEQKADDIVSIMLDDPSYLLALADYYVLLQANLQSLL